MPLTSPRLWIIATPLGNLEDISPRAKSILAQADIILAEDTRRGGMLLRTLGIKANKLLSFFDHNESERQAEVLRALRSGKNIALISDAGTPLMADPGYRLVRACRKENLPVSPIPGPSAPIAALSAAGIPPIPFSFLGFLPRGENDCRKLFQNFANVGTLIFFERKDRLAESMRIALSVLGAREFAICRELTKTYEEFIVGRLEEPMPETREFQGELTIIIGPPEKTSRTSREDVLLLLGNEIRQGVKARQAAAHVRKSISGWSGKEIYALLCELENSGNDDNPM